jgi:hypothetical protein
MFWASFWLAVELLREPIWGQLKTITNKKLVFECLRICNSYFFSPVKVYNAIHFSFLNLGLFCIIWLIEIWHTIISSADASNSEQKANHWIEKSENRIVVKTTTSQKSKDFYTFVLKTTWFWAADLHNWIFRNPAFIGSLCRLEMLL